MTWSYFAEKKAEEEFPRTNGLYFHLFSLVSEDNIALVVLGPRENAGHLHFVFIAFVERDDFHCRVDASELVKRFNYAFLVELASDGVRSFLYEFDEHGGQDEFYLFVAFWEGQGGFDHAVEVHLIFEPELDFLLSLLEATDFSQLPDHINGIVVLVERVSEIGFSFESVFVVDEDVYFSGGHVNQVEWFQSYFELWTSVENDILSEETEFRADVYILLCVLGLWSIETQVRPFKILLVLVR